MVVTICVGQGNTDDDTIPEVVIDMNVVELTDVVEYGYIVVETIIDATENGYAAVGSIDIDVTSVVSSLPTIKKKKNCMLSTCSTCNHRNRKLYLFGEKNCQKSGKNQ